MRQPRIKGQSFCQCVSRLVEGRFLFRTQSPGSVEAEYFVHVMHRLEKACCLQVLTDALMADPFYTLRKVPKRRTLSDQELLDCIETGYGPEWRTQVVEQLTAYAAYAILPKDASSVAGPLCRNNSPAAGKSSLLRNPIVAIDYASLPATRSACSAIAGSGR
jgi:hypothetical protein